MPGKVRDLTPLLQARSVAIVGLSRPGSFGGQVYANLRAFGYPDPARSAVAILSSGLAGLTELSFELEPDRRGGGQATALIRAALATLPAGELVVAAAAPGNAASLRALLAAGFTPLGSVQLLGCR